MRVAIVGGGVGGVTAAIALLRKGIDCAVYEQAPELAAPGASLQLGPNALRLMDELGLLGRLREIGGLPEAVDFVRWDDGRLLLHTPLGAAMEEHFGAPQLDFFRPDLHRLLLGELPADTVRAGRQVLAVEQDDSSITLRLAGGGTARADIAVAADGIRSRIRQQFTGADEPVFSGTVVYRGVAPRTDVLELHPDGLARAAAPADPGLRDDAARSRVRPAPARALVLRAGHRARRRRARDGALPGPGRRAGGRGCLRARRVPGRRRPSHRGPRSL